MKICTGVYGLMMMFFFQMKKGSADENIVKDILKTRKTKMTVDVTDCKFPTRLFSVQCVSISSADCMR